MKFNIIYLFIIFFAFYSCNLNINKRVEKNEKNKYRIERFNGGYFAHGYYEIVKKTINDSLDYDNAKIIFSVFYGFENTSLGYSVIFSHYYKCNITDKNGLLEYTFRPKDQEYNSFIVNNSVFGRKVEILDLDIQPGEEWHIKVHLGFKAQY